MSYSKPHALEYIFKAKFDPEQPQPEIPFTRDDVSDAIRATGGEVPLNLNNFVKDLVRSGNPDARSESARINGYFLREGSHSGTMGVFFRPEGSEAPVIAVICPESLESTSVEATFHPEVLDLIRPDEGGLVAAIEYCHLLDILLGYPIGTVKRVQSPVKLQPHELDSLFVLRDEKSRIALPCEAKSKGRDVITLNQIVGIAAAALQMEMIQESHRSTTTSSFRFS